MKDHRLSTQLLGPPIDPELFPFGTDTIRGYDDCDHDPIGCRSWLVVLAIGLVLPVCIAIGARALREEPYQATGAAYVRAIHAAHPELDDLGSQDTVTGQVTLPAPREPKGTGVTGQSNPRLRASAAPSQKPAPAPPLAGGWHPCSITTYGKRPSGKPYHGGVTASGERYDDYGWTVAVPPRRRGSKRPLVPYGTLIDVTWHGRTLKCLKVTDLCPGMTIDLTRAAMVKLLGHYADTKLRGASWRKSQ